MNTQASPKPRGALFKVTFTNGASVTLTAANSLKAERDAQRCHAGAVRHIRFLRRLDK
ncbi:hypothetical protein [Rhizobium sp. CSW-27]|uniref:hypothetical protein n=1 Tax=Rhizobium sp. CSW-27 TaxID=2839985 RepID=UPI001C012A1D|nr:hypothetical protein [Rhizobium sp. CSW-27]MBT9373213.1 hypothetical protein [Rhizobium sp. CSW-27]